jgi:hypothetical protein
MTKKYQVTELDKVLQKAKEGFPEWTNEKQLEWQLERQEKFNKEKLERMAVKNAELYTDNVLLKRELEEYRNLKSEVHYDIEKVWMFDATLTKDLSAYQKRKRNEAIERVFYKIANQWID